jgi:translation initiation factor 1
VGANSKAMHCSIFMKDTSRLVYSTETGRIKPAKTSAVAPPPAKDAIVRLHRESKGRGGKGVTLITGIPLGTEALKTLAKELKQVCGTGGTVKDGVIEIQGEHREKLKPLLEQKGYQVKIAGG